MDDRDTFLARIAACALDAEKRTGFPAAVTISQACLESAWGTRETGSCNVFGLTKAVAPDQPQKLVPTHERLTEADIERLPPEERATITSTIPVAGHPGVFDVRLSRFFPSFSSLQEATDAYVNLITTGRRYAGAWQHWRAAKDINALIEGIAAAGYASATGYAGLVRQIAAGPRIAKALEEARAG